jgi:hypothetical protein
VLEGPVSPSSPQELEAGFARRARRDERGPQGGQGFAVDAAGSYYNAAPYAVPAPRYRAPTYAPAWGYGDTPYQGRYFDTGVPNWRVGNAPAVAPDSGHEDYWPFLR